MNYKTAAASLLLLSRMVAAQVQTVPTESDEEMSRALKVYIREQIMAADDRRNIVRGGRNKVPLSLGLPEFLPPDLPQAEGFVESERMPDGELAIDTSDIMRQGLKVSDVFEDEEWVRLPDGKSIRREIKPNSNPPGRYEVWHYPPGMRIVHMVYLKNPKRLFELRLELKLNDDPGSDGSWAFGLYRPVNGTPLLKLYTLGKRERPETPVVLADTPTGPRQVRVERIGSESCRVCHIDHGEGWYQYPNEDHAGPCGFAPANKSILAKWAPRYQARYGYFPFTGP